MALDEVKNTKFHARTSHEASLGESRYRSALCVTSALDVTDARTRLLYPSPYFMLFVNVSYMSHLWKTSYQFFTWAISGKQVTSFLHEPSLENKLPVFYMSHLWKTSYQFHTWAISWKQVTSFFQILIRSGTVKVKFCEKLYEVKQNRNKV